MRILNFGSMNIDYVYQVDHMTQPGETQQSMGMATFAGGKGLNQSIALKRAGADVFHAGLVGTDGDFLLDTCRDSGIDITNVKKVLGSSGHTIIQVDHQGQNCILLHSGSNGMMTKEFADSVFQNFSEGDYVLFQNEINMLDYMIETAHKKGMVIILNPSPFNKALECCDLSKVSMFILNEIEGGALAGTDAGQEVILKHISEKYPEAKFVLTLGQEGSCYHDKGKTHYQKSIPVKAVDTTAAGDTYTGFLISLLAAGKSVEQAMEAAAMAAALAVTRKGAAASIPWLYEVLHYRSGRRQY